MNNTIFFALFRKKWEARSFLCHVQLSNLLWKTNLVKKSCWPCHDNRLIPTVQTISYKVKWVHVPFNAIPGGTHKVLWGMVRIVLTSQFSWQGKNLHWLCLAFHIDWRVRHGECNNAGHFIVHASRGRSKSRSDTLVIANLYFNFPRYGYQRSTNWLFLW